MNRQVNGQAGGWVGWNKLVMSKFFLGTEVSIMEHLPLSLIRSRTHLIKTIEIVTKFSSGIAQLLASKSLHPHLLSII